MGKIIIDGIECGGSVDQVAYNSSDIADSQVTTTTGWTTVDPLVSGETNISVFTKLSQMFKNVRWLFKGSQWIDITNEFTFASFCTYKKAIYNPLTKEVRIHITTSKTEVVGNSQIYVTISNSAYKANTSLLATITAGTSYICGIASARYTQSPTQISNIYPLDFVMAYNPSATNDTIKGSYPVSASAYSIMMDLSYFTN